MQCVHCGLNNPPNARYCLSCGSNLGLSSSGAPVGAPAGQAVYYPVPQSMSFPDSTMSETAEYSCRVLGGAGWLMVCAGTFIIAHSWLSLMEPSYYADSDEYLRRIGYGIAVYAFAAALFAGRTFIKRS